MAGLNTTMRNPLENQNTEIHVGPMQRAERRLAAISNQLSEARLKVAAGGTGKELADTGDLAGMIALGARRGEAIRQRALESEMAEAWRGTSMLEYEEYAEEGHLFYACGDEQWETVAKLAAAGEDPAEPYEHGPQRVCLGGAVNLSAMREEVTEWWAGAVKRGQKEVKLVVLAQTASVCRSGAASGNGERIALAGSTTGAGPADLPTTTPPAFARRADDGFGPAAAGRAHRAAIAADGGAGDGGLSPSADELIAAALLFQLMQCLDIEIGKSSHHPSRCL